jgi:hypothetical protein
MNYKQILYKYLLIAVSGFVFYWVDDQAFFNPLVTTFFIVLFSAMKSAYYVFFSYKKILEASQKEVAYHDFMLFMMVNISMVIFSFGVDFFCLNQVNSDNFVGIAPDLTTSELIFETWYFSVLNFSFFGYGEIMPTTVAGKLIIVMEVLMSFVTLVFILSDFLSLKESILEHLKKKET